MSNKEYIEPTKTITEYRELIFSWYNDCFIQPANKDLILTESEWDELLCKKMFGTEPYRYK